MPVGGKGLPPGTPAASPCSLTAVLLLPVSEGGGAGCPPPAGGGAESPRLPDHVEGRVAQAPQARFRPHRSDPASSALTEPHRGKDSCPSQDRPQGVRPAGGTGGSPRTGGGRAHYSHTHTRAPCRSLARPHSQLHMSSHLQTHALTSTLTDTHTLSCTLGSHTHT